jgi:hypothetical protein
LQVSPEILKKVVGKNLNWSKMKATYSFLGIYFLLMLSSIGCSEKQGNNESSEELLNNVINKSSIESSDREKDKSLNAEDNLITIHSTGGAGKNVDYRGYDINNIYELDDLGPFADSYFINGCEGGSVSCKALSASSVLEPNKKTYSVNNLTDRNPTTAWVEGETGYGIGTSFEISCNNLNTIYNGYQNSPSNWMKNGRVKKFKVYIDGKPLCYLILKDEMGEQNFELPFDADWHTPHVFRFEIVEVYEGTKYSDVCISEIGVQGCCFSQYAKLKSPKGDIQLLAPEDSVYSYDITNKILTPSFIKSKIIKQRAQLYEITVDSHKTLITREHRLLTKDYGSLSIMEMISKWNYNSYNQLYCKDHIKVALFINGEVVYGPITKIKRIDGEFKVISIRELSHGKYVIVDGFIQEID